MTGLTEVRTMTATWCGCCGREVFDAEWCPDCVQHVVQGGYAPPWDRTWLAQTGWDCPLQVPA
jgi:hypothetical protein